VNENKGGTYEEERKREQLGNKNEPNILNCNTSRELNKALAHRNTQIQGKEKHDATFEIGTAVSSWRKSTR
jgi:hypothetical protein